MSFLTSEISLDQIDDWFQYGRTAASKSSTMKTVPAGQLLGRPLDPDTGKAYQYKDTASENILPAYRGTASVDEFQLQYDEYIRQSQENVELVLPSAGLPEDMVNQMDQLELDSTVCGSVGVPQDFIPEGATAVYDNYSFQHRYDPKLPITQRAEEVLYTIESNQVTIIQGSTGSGKTTQVPQYILDHYAEKEEYCNIIVTQPRRIAAVSIAKRVCQERDWPLGSVCGYQIGMDMKTSEDTRILYCTTGVLREKLMNKKNMHQFTHVILDEVHERDQESDFALLVVKKLLRTNSRHVKVILMSATMNSDQFSRYFMLPVANQMVPAPVVNVEGQVFKVLRFFADDLSSLGQLPRLDDCDPKLHPDIVDMAVKLIQEFDGLETKEQGVDQGTGFATIRGTVLIFLPGIVEISFVLDQLRSIESSSNLTLIPLHSTITLDEQARAFEKPARGYRKVILSTNIAESSITVPDIKYVIDFCLTKCLVCDHNTNYTHLQLEWASKSNCTQRKGRAGRVSQGRAYLMVTRHFYEHCMEEHSVPEMQRCPLETLVLKTKLLDMGEPIALLSQALSPPRLDNIERTVLSLKQVGALCVTSGGKVKRFDGDLTFVGRVLADLPVDIRVGKLMILGYVFGLLEECIIIGAALSLKSIFATPFQSRLEAFMHKFKWASGSLSDCQAILHAYRVWQKCKELQEFKRTGLTENQWGVKNFIQTRRMNEVHELVRELSNRLEKFNLIRVRPRSDPTSHKVHMEEPGQMSPKDSLFLKIVICGAFYPNYFCKKPVDEREAMKTLCNHDPLNTVVVRGLPQNQGLLYRDHMIDLFKRCCPRDARPTVDFEESRAYIMFPQSDSSGLQHNKMAVNSSVCFAIKLRQLRIPLKLEMYSQEATDGLKRQMENASDKWAAQGFLRTSRVSSANPADDSGLKVALPDPSQSVLEVFVTEVVQCGHFYVQCQDYVHMSQLHSLHMMLNPASRLAKLGTRPHKDMMCAAPYMDEQEAYYRARIEKLETQTFSRRGIPTTVRVARVFFVDYGNREEVTLDRLRALPLEAHNIPSQAIECELMEIRPSSVKCPDGRWTVEANMVFKNIVFGKKFLAQVYSVLNSVVRLELVQPTPQGGEISINEHLIGVRLAEKVEETYLSKQDHEWRMAEATGANAMQDGSKETRTVAPAVPTLQLDVKCPPAGFRRKGRTINLMGPINPLEMEFLGATFSTSHRFVRVDPDSVNSTAVDPEPQNKFNRMMVSAFLSLNADGDTIVARDTTIMPQIPGMLAMMSLIFSPIVELRVDARRQRYTGALCGLGFAPGDKNHPLLPEHDMELTFDVDFDDDDIHLINRVRHAINLALGSRTSMAEWGPDAVAAKIQMPARERLLELLYKAREHKEPEYFYSGKEFHWNQLKVEEIVLPSEDFDNDFLTLLPPLATVQLDTGDRKGMDQKRMHIDELHRIASKHMRGPITCQLCKVTVQTSQLMAIHLETERHLRREQKVIDHYCNK
ncbi:ATP-dependent RNA helicase TDRD9-like [Babylonia areolata]|uniref:ATP-dependent RNA helicase TDRD9-like n=1 Tax=Babylonia areolata TaxID=304850 RepID=UPI003FD2BA4F